MVFIMEECWKYGKCPNFYCHKTPYPRQLIEGSFILTYGSRRLRVHHQSTLPTFASGQCTYFLWKLVKDHGSWPAYFIQCIWQHWLCGICQKPPVSWLSLVSSKATAKAPRDASLSVRDVSELTRFPEMMVVGCIEKHCILLSMLRSWHAIFQKTILMWPDLISTLLQSLPTTCTPL